MLNAEKYKYEIAEAGYDFGLYDDQCIDGCDYVKCPDCKFYNEFTGCRAERIRWLLEEYKEPILTDEEKVIIKDIIKAFEPFGNKARYIRKRIMLNGCCIKFCYEDDCLDSLFFDGGKLFKGMELDKDYTLEELGLNDA